MHIWLLLLAISASSQQCGNLTISQFSIFPSVLGSPFAQFSLTLKPQFPIPAQETIIQLKSPYPFLTKPDRKDCFLSGLSDVYVSSCSSQGRYLNATIYSPYDLDLRDSINLTVFRAFAIPQNNKTDPFEVSTSWNGEVINCNNSIRPEQMVEPEGKVEMLNISLMEAMENSFTPLIISFSLDFPLTPNVMLMLLFPEEFDPTIGKVIEERMTLACNMDPPELDPTCFWGFSSINVTINSPVPAKTLIRLNITYVRMPKDEIFSPIQLLFVRQSTVLALRSKVASIEKYDLNLECCILYDRLSADCSNVELLAVCADFHFNIAQFSSDMNEIRVLFKQQMNISAFRKLGKAGENCNLLFLPKTVRQLGDSPICRWIQHDELTIYLGMYPTVRNSMLFFIPGALCILPSGRPWLPSSLRILYPKKMPIPAATITKVGVVSQCEEAVLDCWKTTGTGRRNLNCMWYVDGVYILTAPTLSLGEKFVTSNQKTLLVRLEATNEWKKTGSVEVEVQVDLQSDLRVSFPFGATLQFYYSAAFTIYPTISLSKCAKERGAELTLTKSWQSNSTELQAICSKSVHFCSIPERALPVGNYSLTLSVDAPTSDIRFMSYVSTLISVERTKMRIIVLGGNRILTVDQDFVLDGSLTIDPDSKEYNRKIMLNWTLFDSNMKPDSNFTSIYGYKFTIPKGYMLPKKKYYVKVQTPRLEFRDSISDTLWIETTKAPTYTIFIIPPFKKNPTDIIKICPILLMNFFTENYECVWNQTTTHNYQQMSDIKAPILVFAPESLDPGMVYTFEYLCTSALPDGEISLSKAEVTININEVPSGGVFDITPTQGIEMITEFSLIARNWKDNDGDFPLRYQYYNKKEDAYVPLTAKMLQTSVKTSLSRFDNSDKNAIYLHVCDSLDACSRVQQSVYITSTADNAQRQLTLAFEYIESTRAATNDSRAMITTIGQVSSYIGQKFAEGLLNKTEAAAYLSAVSSYIREAADFLANESIGGLSTEDQETLLSVVMRTMVPGVISNSLIADSIDILKSILNLTETGYTTGPLYVKVMSSMQESIDLSLGESGTATADQIKVADYIHEISDMIVGQIVARLTPGQFPAVLVESAMSVYAVRQGSSDISSYEIQLKVHYGDKDGYYNISLPSNHLDDYRETGEIVVEYVVSTLKIPPSDALINILPQLICQFDYPKNDAGDGFVLSQSCNNYTLTTPGTLTTVYPTFKETNSGRYNQSTGNTADNSTPAPITGSYSVVHEIPVVEFQGEIDCIGRNADGILDTNLCRQQPSFAGVTCQCVKTAEIIPKPITSVQDAIKGAEPYSNGSTSDWFGDFSLSAGNVLIFATILTFLSFLAFFHAFDLYDRPGINHIQFCFGLRVKEVVKRLADWNRLVKVKRPMYRSKWLFFLFFLKQKKLYSLESLFEAFHSHKRGSKDKLVAGIKAALVTISKEKKWRHNGVIKSFEARIAEIAYLRQITGLYFRFQVGGETYLGAFSSNSVSSSAQAVLCGRQIEYRSCSLFTDDLIAEMNLWSRFVHNNEFIGIFFNRRPSKKRLYRAPILAVTFLGPMLSYAINFENINSSRLDNLLSILWRTNGKLWDESGWRAALVLFVVFLVIGTGTEKLVLWVKPDYAEARYATHLFPLRPSTGKRCRVAKLIFARWIPFTICVYLIVHLSLLVNRMDVNDSVLVLAHALVSFIIGVGVFFGIGSVMVGLYVVKLLWTWGERKMGGRWVLMGVKGVVWTPLKNVGKAWYQPLRRKEW